MTYAFGSAHADRAFGMDLLKFGIALILACIVIHYLIAWSFQAWVCLSNRRARRRIANSYRTMRP